MKAAIIQGFIDGYGEAVVQCVTAEGVISALPLRLEVENHSPTGFQWGYAGSGPAQLALAIACEYLSIPQARRVYQAFKFQVIAGLSQFTPWTLTESDIKDHLERLLGEAFKGWK
jgi:hypothetical protein